MLWLGNNDFSHRFHYDGDRYYEIERIAGKCRYAGGCWSLPDGVLLFMVTGSDDECADALHEHKSRYADADWDSRRSAEGPGERYAGLLEAPVIPGNELSEIECLIALASAAAKFELLSNPR